MKPGRELDAVIAERDRLRLEVHDLTVALDEGRKWREHYMRQASRLKLECDELRQQVQRLLRPQLEAARELSRFLEELKDEPKGGS